LLNRGDIQGATAQIDEVLKKDPNDRQALLLRARVRSLGGQAENLKVAIEDLKEVLKQEPNSRAGLYFMAQMNFNLGAIDEARSFAVELERNYPDYLPAKLMQVQISSSTGDPKTALRLASDLLERLNKTAPDQDNSPQLLAEIREKTYLARGGAQLRLGNAPAARADFDAARQVISSDPDIYNSLAFVSLAEKNSDEAIGFFENALQIDNSNFNAFNGLINVYAQRKELNKAHARLQTALDANPNKPTLHYLKGIVYAYEPNAQGAEAEWRKAIELDQNYLAAYSALGTLFINLKQEDRAIAEYKKITEIRPDNATAYTLIGMLEYARKNSDAAIDSYRKALERDQNAIIAANNLAWIYAIEGKGNIDEALKLAQGAVQKSPNIAGFIDTLGWVYYKKGLYAAAVEQLQKAVTVDAAAARANNANPSATYHFHLGMALKAKGDSQGARRELESAIRLGEKVNFPDAEEARKTLATL
jgi:tetratricopeptide (TPR) repeat protein